MFCLEKQLNVELINFDITKIFRLKSNNDRQGKIIINFSLKSTKDKLVSGLKSCKSQVTSKRSSTFILVSPTLKFLLMTSFHWEIKDYFGYRSCY